MKINLTIGRRIGLGFGVLIFLTLLNFILTGKTLFTSREINEKINNVYIPSVDVLEEYNLLITRSKMLISNWVFITSPEENLDKQKLKKLIDEEYPQLKAKIQRLAVYWDTDEQKMVNDIFNHTDSLFNYHKEIMTQLNSFASYEDAMIMFLVRPMVEGGEVDIQTNYILDKLSIVSAKQQENSKIVSNDMIDAFNLLQRVVTNSGVALLIGGILIAFFTVSSIVKPVHQLRDILKMMGRGIQPNTKLKHTKDEIGEMSIAMEHLIDGLKRTTEFSKQVGSGNFDADYKPLSKEDVLGSSLLLMRTELKELTGNLEAKVEERTLEVVQEKKKVEHLLNEVTDSIRYAKRIQNSILPSQLALSKLPEHFILYKPKDIVSGDFYWFESKGNELMLAAVDCTGHGVPGALMSIVGSSLLNNAVFGLNLTTPSLILDELNKGVSRTLRQGENEAASKDGMDITFLNLNLEQKKVQFAGAFNPLYHFKGDELVETKADKFPIGHFAHDESMKYTNHEFDLQAGDVLYMFSDGYCDQFGGPDGKKFMYKKFRNMLHEIKNKPMSEQRIILDQTIENWREESNQEQLDDILVIGVRIPS